MRVALFHNEDAGDGVACECVAELLQQHGHELIRVVERKADFDRLLAVEPDAVIAAGGDGTVATAMRRLAGGDVPLAILPTGTANNIAHSLGSDRPIAELIGRWSLARRQSVDIGTVHGPFGERRFVEAIGTGLVTAGIAAMDATPADHLATSSSRVSIALERYRQVLADLRPQPITVTVDGQRVSCQALLVEVLNMRSVGPGLLLSPRATPSDGAFSVVVATDDDRSALACYLHERGAGREATLTLPTWRAREVVLDGWTELHVDDAVLRSHSPSTADAIIRGGAVEVLR
jgi:diacylglycerol kinase family enzyme